MSLTYDFIVVGSGPSGCAVAAGLAGASKSTRVLLIEAGNENNDRTLRIDGQRWLTHQNKHMNWGYKSTAQPECNDREIAFDRGRSLGGSSAVNFGVYSVGARDDYNEWARVVGDVEFTWENIQRRFKNLETFHGDTPPGIDAKYAAPKASDHGTSGPLHVGFSAEWERDLTPMLDVFEQAGFPKNPDHNSGNPIGMSVLISSAHRGQRSTAVDLLKPVSENLTVITGSPVQRVVLEGKKVVGVESNGTQYFATKEVILSAGALDTPRILMHSGIGPAKQLEAYSIPVVQDTPALGQGLRDHYFVPLFYSRTRGSTDRQGFYGDQVAMDAALEQWQEDGTGPWAKFGCEMGIGWFKLDRLVESEEFKSLPAVEQRYLMAETVPHYETFTHFPMHWFAPDFPVESVPYSCLLVFSYNAQTRGETTLQSADPSIPLKFDPKFLAHPFDRRAAIEALRDALRVTKHEGFSKDTVEGLSVPKSESDDDLLEYWRQNMVSSWHMMGTAKMGKPEDGAEAVVDNNFRVSGIDGLRIADMSVLPVLPSCHVQAVAYVTGLTCAEKMVKEYGLTEPGLN